MIEDPLSKCSFDEYAISLRSGRITAADVVEAYLSRIEILNSELNAYVEVYVEEAEKAAKAIDACLRNGVDLGPLMGVPIAVKDIFAVRGTKTRAGSLLEIDDLVGEEGSFIARLKRAGCIVLGKTHTTEFAFSPSGINHSAHTPRNPHDGESIRIPGGSSGGSAVAVAAGLCGFAVGSDTGGSIRVPAALNGIVGLKTTVGLWPTDGVFSLSTTLDSIGIFTRSVRDMRFLISTLEGVDICKPLASTARIGLAEQYFFEDLDKPVFEALRRAVSALESAGITLVKMELPEASERAPMSSQIMTTELIATFGRDRLLSQLDRVDGAVQARIREFSQVPADEYVRSMRRHHELTATIGRRTSTVDAWLSPVVPCEAPLLTELQHVDAQTRMNFRLTRNSQPINIFGQCAMSIPVPVSEGMPIGLQVACGPWEDEKLIGIAGMLETILGRQSPPCLDRFALNS